VIRRLLLVLACAAGPLAAAVVPGAIAAERPPQVDFNGAFELDAANGFHVFGLVASFEGKAQVSMFVSKDGEAAIYTARGVGTPNSVDVDFGALGKVDLEAVPTGKIETVGSDCGGQGKTTTVPGSEFIGTVEFHGEESFTEFSATRLPLRVDPLLHLVCAGGPGVTTTSGPHTGGILLKARTADSPSLVLQQNHPGASVFYEVRLHEKEGTVQVSRTVSGRLGAGAIRYAPSLESASFAAASPFSGNATYTGRAAPNRASPGRGAWLGSLKVDFPGHAAVSIAGPTFKASVKHAHRTETPR
jgi:hypothetical protein